MLEHEKLSHIVAVALLLIAVSMIATASYFDIPARAHLLFQNRVACTQEAKLCPDGSAVGRTGPNCEFIECAKTVIAQVDTSTWQTYRNEEYGFEVKYPPLSLQQRVEQNGAWLYFKHDATYRVGLDFDATMFILGVSDNLGGLEMNEWFKNNVDDDDILSKSGIIKKSQLKNGWQLYNLDGPLDPKYQDKDGLICDYYAMPLSRRFVIVLCPGGETAQLESFGYDSFEKKRQLYVEILSLMEENY